MAVFLTAASIVSPVHADPVELTTFAALAKPTPGAVLEYGPAPSQAVDVFLPGGKGPHPVAILIHGGCWRDLPGAGREQLRPIASELANRGIAVWSIGYRRADEQGGGYPGTFQDVATGIDQLRLHAARYDLDVSRTVVVGHSAGGHLALWASLRDQLPAGSPLRSTNASIPGSVISLAGVPDLKAFGRFVPLLCGPGIIEKLAPHGGSIDPYADTSPAQLPPPRGPVVMVSGILDRLVPPYVADDYARSMRRAHSKAVTLVEIPGAGHFDLVTPGTAAWKEVESRIVEAVRAGS
ncbi:MAG TPA: alpha/beta hydrolase [Steroidobacteraceae bacterium]|nr:alpha/beta hydrolase [Steroidobacteraceae bacterium]